MSHIDIAFSDIVRDRCDLLGPWCDGMRRRYCCDAAEAGQRPRPTVTGGQVGR
jgi:hypothetical protein